MHNKLGSFIERQPKIPTLGSQEVWPELVKRLGRLTPRIGRKEPTAEEMEYASMMQQVSPEQMAKLARVWNFPSLGGGGMRIWEDNV